MGGESCGARGEKGRGLAGRVRPSLASFEPYDPAFTPCRVNLSANENTHEMPEEYADAVRAALAATPLNRYPDPMANALRDALARRHGVSRGSIVVGNGGDEVLFNLLMAFGGRAYARHLPAGLLGVRALRADDRDPARGGPRATPRTSRLTPTRSWRPPRAPRS